MRTWPCSSNFMFDRSLGGADEDQWLIVMAACVEQRVVESEPDPVVAHGALERITGNRNIGQTGNFDVAIRARLDIAERAGRTGRDELGREITAVHTLRAGRVCDNVHSRTV